MEAIKKLIKDVESRKETVKRFQDLRIEIENSGGYIETSSKRIQIIPERPELKADILKALDREIKRHVDTIEPIESKLDALNSLIEATKGGSN